MEENGNIEYISTNFRHKKRDRNGNSILEDRKTEIDNIIVTGIGNHRS